MNGSMRENYQDNLGYEVLNGKIVNMSPAGSRHTTAIGNIYAAMHSHFRGKPCRPFVDGLMVHLTEKDKVVPDVMVVCRPEIVKEAGIYGAPDLIVEVLSPSTALNDKGYKRGLYERCGVREYWIVDIKSRSVEEYRLTEDGYKLEQVYSQQTPGELELLNEEQLQLLPDAVCSCIFPDLSIPLEDIFEFV